MKKGTIKTVVVAALLMLAIAIPLLVQAAPKLCNNGADDDNDGLTDYPNDPGCSSQGDNTETGTDVCDNGLDETNDADALADYRLSGGDTGCTSVTDTSEIDGECDDKTDNDGDGQIDYSADAGCSSYQDNDETNCGDGAVSGSEVCDGTNLNGQTCVTQGFGGGTLSCGATCSSFVTTSCWTNTCSDTDGGTVQGTQGTVSGSYQGTPYSNTDSCIDSIALTEWRCVTVGSGLGGGLTGSSSNYNCNQINGSNYTMCASGACQ